jgi:hypothetical protein
MAAILDQGEQRTPPEGRRRLARLVAALRRGGWPLALTLLWLAAAAPFLLGQRSLLLRDVVTSHLPLKHFGAERLAAGEIPATNPGWALGQAFRGDPNALAYYPGNVLYLFLPFFPAFNLHYFAHLLVAFFGMRALARAYGQDDASATLAGIAYAGSGYLATAMSFYNLIAVAAWTPVALAALVRGGRRGALAAGLAAGMLLLAGEPVTAALVAPLALFVALERWGWRRGSKLALAAGALALLVALPQIVASARALPHAFRFQHGVPVAQAATNALPPARLLELLLPLPWGAISRPPPDAHWATALSPWPPYIHSLHFGVVAAALLLFALRARRRWALAAALPLALAGLAGLSPEWTSKLTLGLFRYPQKLLLPFTVAAALLAGWGLAAARARRRAGGAAHALALAGALLVTFAAAGALARERFAARLGALFAPDAPEPLLLAQAVAWSVALLVAGALLLLAALALARGRVGLLLVAQLAGVAQLAPLVPSDRTAELARAPAWAAELPAGGRVVSLASLDLPWEPRPPYGIGAHRAAERRRLDRELLEPAFARLAGLDSPLAPDLAGLSTPLQVLLARALAAADWPARIRWLRRLGVDAVVRDGAGEVPGLRQIAAAERHGVEAELLAVPAPRSFLFRPRRLRVAPTPLAAFHAIARGELGEEEALVARAPAVAQGELGSARLVAARPDELLLEVEGDGGVIGLLRAAHPLWRARIVGGEPLRTAIVDLALLGVEVPPGTHRVRLWIPAWPERLALALALLAAAGALAALAWLRRSER